LDDKVKHIWNEFSSELYKYINSKVKNKYDTEDILQDVFLKIHKNIDKINDHSKLKSWLYKITKNTIIDYYKKKKEVENKFVFNKMKYQKQEEINEKIIFCNHRPIIIVDIQKF